MKLAKIGKISGAQGLRGEVKIYHDSGDEEALERLSFVYIAASSDENESKPTKMRIESRRMHKRTPILCLEGISDRGTAEALVGAEVFADEAEFRPDEEGVFLVSDLVGLEVHSRIGIRIGKVEGVISNPAHDILEIETGEGIHFLPFLDIFISKVDIKSKIMIIEPPEGWME